MLSCLHDQSATASPSPEQVYMFAKMFGSYVGEAFRKNHGAMWGIVQLGEDSMPGLQSARGERLFWPWGKVQNRLVNGSEDNVAYYYHVLVGECGKPQPQSEWETETESTLPGKPKSWWSRLRGV